MLSFTRKTDYALVALAYLASDSGGAAPAPMSVRQIADRFSLPVPQLMNVFKDLQRAGLVTSSRGVRGGYSLARAPEQIRMDEVVEATEGPVRLMICCDGEQEDQPCQGCQVLDQCPVSDSIQLVNQRIADYLGEISIRDLLDRRVGTIEPIQVRVAVGTEHDTRDDSA
ncbi:MAG: hypothetical protein CMJ18_18960 [Phycisphaeraceae bacterium]|nr:hypothetical protein [Phycisphaeraceae bacterium]